jgi:TolB-like protein
MRKWRQLGARDYALESVESRGDRVVVAFSWAGEDGRRHKWAQALRLKEGKIIDMQDFASRTRAAALMRVRTAFG